MAQGRHCLGREPLRRILHQNGDSCLVLHHYAASESQPRHSHDHVQVSFLLAGRHTEVIGARPQEVATSSACVKLAGTEHANAWGSHGVLMLSLRMPSDRFDRESVGKVDCWSRVDAGDLRAMTRAALSHAEPADHGALYDDLLALLPGRDAPGGPIPPWLQSVTSALMDDPTIRAADLAELAGVHRVHLSRTFARHIGVPLTVYRRQTMLARALEAALRTAESLSQVAQLAGFADQSHMNREIGAAFGVTPTVLRRGFARFES